MVQVPIPQEQLQGGSTGSFRAFTTVPQRSATGAQIAGLGEAVQAAGTAAANIFDVLQDDLDTAQTKEALAVWKDENRVVLHSANPADLGYLNKQGKAATGAARVNAQNRIARTAETLSNGLDNDVQRSMFAAAVSEQTTQLSQQMDIHEARAIGVYSVGQAKALSEESAGDAVDARTLPVPDLFGFQSNMTVAIDEAQKVADLLGYPPAQARAFVQDTTTAIHAGVIDRFLKQGNTDLAADYFQGVDPDEMRADVRTRIVGVLQTANMQDRGQDLSDIIVDEVDALSTEIQQAQRAGTFRPGQDPIRLDADDRLVEALRNLKERDMPSILRQVTRQRIEQHYSDQANREATILNDLVTNSKLTLAADLTMGPSQLPAEDIHELVRTGQWPTITAFAKTARVGGATQAFATFMGLTNEELLAMTSQERLILDTTVADMTTAQQNTVIRRWEQARAPTVGAPDRGVTVGERLNILAKRHGLQTVDGNFIRKSDEAIFDAVQIEANQRLLDVENTKGRQSGKDLMDILNSAFLDMIVVHDPGFWSAERRVLRRSLSQAQLFGAPFVQSVVTQGIAVTGSSAVSPAVRVFKLEDQDETRVRLTVPVNDHLVARLRAARARDPSEPRVTNQAIFDLWVDLGSPETLEELGVAR